MLHHLLEELDDDLGCGSDHDLSFSPLLGVEDGAEAVVEHGDAHGRRRATWSGFERVWLLGVF